MTEQKETEIKRKPLTLSRPGRLELNKTVETGKVRQSFSHGRSKTVQVEVKRKKTFKRTAGGNMQAVSQPDATASPAPIDAAAAALTTLTDVERAARVRALQGARDGEARRLAAAAEVQRHAEAEELRRREEDARRQAEEEEARRRAEEKQRQKAEEEARQQREAETGRRAAETAAVAAAKAPAKPIEADKEPEHPGRGDNKRGAPARRTEPRRRSGKLTIAQALEEDSGERVRSLAAVKRAREREKQRARQKLTEAPSKVVREVVIPEAITVQNLANRMAERGGDVIKTLMKLGFMATIT